MGPQVRPESVLLFHRRSFCSVTSPGQPEDPRNLDILSFLSVPIYWRSGSPENVNHKDAVSF